MAARGQGFWLQLHRGFRIYPLPQPRTTASSAPHPGCPQRCAWAGAPGGGGAGRGRALALSTPPSFPQARRRRVGRAGENEWVGASRWRTLLWPGRGGRHQRPFPPTPRSGLFWAPTLSRSPLLPLGGRGAGVGWEGRSRGRVEWGQEGGGWGAERAEAAGRLLCRSAPGWGLAVWPGLLSPCFAPPQPPTQCGSKGVLEPWYAPRPLPAGGAGLALIGAGGAGEEGAGARLGFH